MQSTNLPIKCISSVWQSSDGKLFTGTESAREDCRRHEIDLVLNHVLPRLSEIGYVEKDATEYGELFARRHHGTLISATPCNVADWHDLVNYVTLKHEVPDLIREEGKLTPELPFTAHILVYKGVKRAHARMIPDSFLRCMIQQEEEMKKAAAPKRAMKTYLYGNKMLPLSQIAAITGVSPGAIRSRLSRGWTQERAFTTPSMTHDEVCKAARAAKRREPLPA